MAKYSTGLCPRLVGLPPGGRHVQIRPLTFTADGDRDVHHRDGVQADYGISSHAHLQLAPHFLFATGDLCGLQAQLLGSAELALVARVDGLRRGWLERELWQERRLVKTWAMRGTAYVLPARDLPVYIGAFAAGAAQAAHQWLSRYGVSREDIEILTHAVVQALADGPLTRKELGGRVARLAGEGYRPWVEHSWGGGLKQAARRGLICFGPPRGQQATFVRLESWLPRLEPLPEQEARERLMIAYLRACGPATLKDFSVWTGLRMAEARAARDGLADRLTEVRLADATAYLPREDLDPFERADGGEQSVRLLPSFDPYLLGHADKALIVDRAHYKRIYRQAGWISAAVLHGGKVVGVWSHRRASRTLDVTVELFASPSPEVERGLEAEVARLAAYFDAEPALTVAVD